MRDVQSAKSKTNVIVMPQHIIITWLVINLQPRAKNTARRMRSDTSIVLLLSLFGYSQAFSASSHDYLSSLSETHQQAPPSWAPLAPSSPPLTTNDPVSTDSFDQSLTVFSHAPISYFAIDNLTSKGPRKNADVGQPHDATRPLTKVGAISAGSWWCAEGGWPSPVQRVTTEIFFVLKGHGCLTDWDGRRHYFGPGDTVILPKGWSGRWDIMEAIHKVWFVHDHPHIEETSHPIRVVVRPYSSFAPQHLQSQGVRTDASHGSPSTASCTIYNVGPTQVGCWTCTPGSFPVVDRANTECFHVLEGVFFLTNAADGTAQRCQAGDTVVLPKGWSGYWDVIETVRKLWVVI